MTRTRFFPLAVLLCFLGLTLRALEIQVLRGEEIASELSERGRTVELLAPVRGTIVDRKDRPLATVERSFDLFLVAGSTPPPVLARVAKMTGLPPAAFRKAEAKSRARAERIARRFGPRFDARQLRKELKVPYLVARNIPEAAAFEIAIHPELYPGLSVRESWRRKYPEGTLAAHLLGYTGTATEGEQERIASEILQRQQVAELLRTRQLIGSEAFQQQQVGKFGVERALDSDLRGTWGLAVTERDSATRSRLCTRRIPPEPGRRLKLSIDADWQRHVELVLAKSPQPAAAVLVDPSSGEILALASKPTFDPNDFVPPVSADRLRPYFAGDSLRPLWNRAATGQYALGSIFKIVTAFAALNSGVISPSSSFECLGHMGRQNALRCWIYRQSGTGHGPLCLAEALERSCNCYFFHVAGALGRDRLETAARDLGFGKRTGTGLIEEARGVLPSDRTKGRWTEYDTMSFSIGQSTLLATPLQVARLMTAVASGILRPLTLVALDAAPPGVPLPLEALTEIRRGMELVTRAPGGTAYSSGLALLGAAGKTGSAQTFGGRPSHAWFAGYAPADNPRLAIVVFVEHGGSGGEVAAPLAASILRGPEGKR